MIKIREATPEDARGITNVFHQTWLDTYPDEVTGITKEDIVEKFKDAYSESKLTIMADHIRNIGKDYKYTVAVYNKNIIGVCRIINREEFCQLQAIYVLPEHQGQGVGNMLWDESLKFFDKSKKIIVQVATYNEKAIRFYESLGFKDNGVRFSEERHRMPISKALIPEMEMEII